VDHIRSGEPKHVVLLIGSLLVLGSVGHFARGVADAGPSRAPATEEIIFVSEDTAIPPIDGCDGVSSVEIPSGKTIAPGESFISPGRLAGTTTLSYVLSPFANSRHALYVLHRPVPDEDTWRFMGVAQGAPIAYSSGIAILPDDDTFVVASGSSYRYDPRHVHAIPPFSVSAYRLSEIVWEESRGVLGAPVFAMETAGLAGEILLSADGSRVHIVLDQPARVTTLDTDTWKRAAPDIELQPLSRFPGYIAPGTAPNFVHATLDIGGKHIISNRLDSNEINVADVTSRKSWTLELPRSLGGPLGGVDVSRGPSNNGRLAVHGTKHVGVYSLDPTGGLVEVSRSITRIQDSSVPHDLGPTGRLAWSKSGEYLIAEDIAGQAEFSIFRVDSHREEMERTARITACKSPISEWPIYILTGNRIYWVSTCLS